MMGEFLPEPEKPKGFATLRGGFWNAFQVPLAA
jgi:hypothetical protein